MEQDEMKEPTLIEIANGWAAHGDRWAVHGRTREEAIEKFRKAEKRRREILAMPPWYMQLEEKSSQGSNYS